MNWFAKGRKGKDARQREALSAFIDGALSPREAEHLQKQLTANPTLRAEYDELHRTVQLLRSAPAVRLPRFFTLDPAVYGKVKPRRVYAYPVLRAATAVATVLMIVLFAGDMFLGVGLPAAPEVVSMATLAPAAEMVDIEQMNRAAEPELLIEVPAAQAVPEESAKALIEVTREVELVVEATVEGLAAQPTPMPTATSEPVVAESDMAATISPEEPLAGASAGEPAEAQEESPTPLATDEPAPLAMQAPAEESSPEPTMEPVDTTPVPSPVAELAPSDVPTSEPVDWLALARVGLVLAAAGLLAATLLARRFGW